MHHASQEDAATHAHHLAQGQPQGNVARHLSEVYLGYHAPDANSMTKSCPTPALLNPAHKTFAKVVHAQRLASRPEILVLLDRA